MTAPLFISEPVAASVGTVITGRAWVGIIQFSTETFVRHNLIDNQARGFVQQRVNALNFATGFTHTRDATQAALDLYAAQSDDARAGARAAAGVSPEVFEAASNHGL